MMNYTELHNNLSTLFDLEQQSIVLSELNTQININKFCSPKESEMYNSYTIAMQEAFMGYNSLSFKNLNFRYPVFQPAGEKGRNGAIILMHGLNERSWDKYLSWASQLVRETGKSVILFPISLHMNRSPESWGDPRQMSQFVKNRKKFLPEVDNISVANVALSERLTNEPEQFFLSGYQSTLDIIKLAKNIKNGELPQFNKNANIDFFGYSIGAFLSEILLLANPENLFENSRCFFFCGGSAFSELNGRSKYILDNIAFERINEFYLKDLEHELKRKNMFSKLLTQTQLGNAFRHMISLKDFRRTPRHTRKRISEQITAVALKRDHVVPLKGLKKTLKKIRLNVLDFNYEYTHEMPFPIFSNSKHKEVDLAFEKVFSIAGAALAK